MARALGGRGATPARCGTVSAVGPAVAAGSLLSGVAATSSCDAWAVGSDPAGSRTEPLIEHWNGQFWRQVPSPQPGTGQSAGGTLAAVAAVSFGDALAVGWSATAALAEHWDGSSWKLSPVLGVAKYRGSRLLAVATAKAGGEWAVGAYQAGPGSRSRGLIARLDGTSWKLAAAPMPSGASGAVLDGVTVSSSGVWAVGYAVKGTGKAASRTALVEHWNGAIWQIMPLAGLSARTSVLSSVTSAPGGVVWAAGSATAAHGQPAPLFTASRSGTPEDEYKWQAYATTQSVIDPVGNTVPVLTGPISSWCYFWIDSDAPFAPTVTSTNYTSGQATNPVGTQGSFSFTDPSNLDPGLGINDVAGYYYGIDDSRPGTYVQAQYEGGPITITLVPFTSAEEDLYVAAVDEAGNIGPVTGPFRIDTTATGNIATLGWWKLNNNANDFATITGTSNASVSGASFGCPGSATASPNGYDCSLALSGSDSAVTGVPMVGNNGSFSVSAWVYPSACSGLCVAVSQDATNVSGFRLGYLRSGTADGATCPCWEFAMPQYDASSAAWSVAAVSTANNSLNTWAQITGVFNAAHGTLTIYADGNTSSTRSAQASPWSSPATGPFRIGADLNDTTAANFFTGSVSDVCAFYGVLNTGSSGSNSDIQNLWDGGTGDGCSTLYNNYP